MRRGLNPSRSFHSQAVLLLPNNNISIVIGTNSWISMAICPVGLSPVFTDATCWLCYLVREKERKQNRSVDLFFCPICRSSTLSGVCFSICFPYREINKLGIKIQINTQHLHLHLSLSEEVGEVVCDLLVCWASVLTGSQGYPAKPANTFTPKLSRIDNIQTKGNQWFSKLASKKSTREKNSQGSDPDVAEVVGTFPLNSMEPKGLMLAKVLAPKAFPAASLSLGCCQEVNTVIVE